MFEFAAADLRERVREVIARLPGRPGPGAAQDAGAAPRGPLPWRALANQAFWMWLATRAVFVLITYFAQLVTVRPGAPGTPLPLDSFGAWQRYDVNWYLGISATGYPDLPRAAFFPLYPLLIALATAVLGGGLRLLAAMLVSNLATLAAYIGLGLLAANEEGNAASAPALRMFAAYPLALFTFAAYADSLFVACAAFALLAARRERWLAAAGCAFLAALTRPTGVILILPLAWEYGRRRKWWHGWSRRWRERRWALPDVRLFGEAASVILAVPLALGLYAAFLWWRFGDPLAFVHVQALVWHRGSVAPWQTLGLAWQALFAAPFWSAFEARLWLDTLPVVAALALTVAGARRLPLSFTLYMLGLLVIALVAPKSDNGIPLAAAGRYLLPAVPLFLLLGRWARRWPTSETLLVGGGFALQAIFTAYFLTGGYVI